MNTTQTCKHEDVEMEDVEYDEETGVFTIKQTCKNCKLTELHYYKLANKKE